MLDLLRQIDFSVVKYFNELINRSFFLESLTLVFARYGVVLFILAGVLLLYSKQYKSFFTASLSVAISGLLNSIIHSAWSRPRPFIAHAAEIHPLSLVLNPESFPSNHAVIIFAVVAAFWITDQKRSALWLLLLAILIIMARVAAGVHYPSDVLIGALLGTAVAPLAKQIYLLIQKLNQEKLT